MSLEVLEQKYRSAVTPKDIIFYGYLYQEKKCFGLDYNDLITFTLYIFDQNPDIRRKWQERLEYIMIDEFQDIDGLQYRLMKVLCGHHRNLFVVGDPDQTIYTWRGANVRYLLDFDRDFPEVKTIMMMDNYRSSPEILAAANSLIEKNGSRMAKELIPHCPGGSRVECHLGKNAAGEARWIAGRIQKLHEEGTDYRDITILYRAHYVTRTVEEALLAEKIPYTIYSGVQFFGRAEIKDALSYLRMIAYQDDLSFLRIANVPRRNLGERRMRFLREYADSRGCTLYQALTATVEDPIFQGTRARQFLSLVETYRQRVEERQISELLSALLNDSGYEEMLRTEGSQERLDNLAELKQSVYEYETTCGEESMLEHYLSHVALFSNSDAAGTGDKVKLMTVHASKGLEFPHVFLCGMNEGIFPSRKVRTLEGMEEERRLAFVAMTRAERGLYLSEAAGSNLDGSPRYPSRFLLDVDQKLLDYTEPVPEGLIGEVRTYLKLSAREMAMEEASLYEPGQRVRHRIFGEGTVLEADREKRAHVIQFDELETPRRISFRVELEVL